MDDTEHNWWYVFDGWVNIYKRERYYERLDLETAKEVRDDLTEAIEMLEGE